MKERDIILALFNPQTEHAKGCLWDDPHIKPHGPCICGFSEVVGRYRRALSEAKEIATKHYGSTFNAGGPVDEDVVAPLNG